MKKEKNLTGYPSIDKPWLKYYSEEAINEELPKCTMYELLWQSNKNHLDNIALNYYGRKFSYKQVFDNIEKTARAFSALGVKKGDIVIICTVNTPEMVYALYALNRLGAIANMVDPRTNVDGIHEYISESNAQLAITIDLAYPAILKAAKGTAIKQIIVISPADSLPPITKILYRLKTKTPLLDKQALVWKDFVSIGENVSPIYAPYEKNTCCVMAHTGGTTGVPKSVMLSNDNINALAYNYRHIDIPITRGERFFNDLPPFIMYGLCFALHTTLYCGLEVIIYPVFSSKDFPKQFKKYKPHHFCSVPDHLNYLSTSRITSKMDLSHLITVGVGGDSLDCTLEKKVNTYLKNRGCKYKVVKGYGMTELSATAISSCIAANGIGCVGIPLIINTVKIVDDTMKELKYNETGEIWISGASVMLGYFNKPEETAQMIITDSNGTRWIRTGDLGYMTPDGLVYHQGRIRRIYITAYEGQPAKIFPMPVEETLKKSMSVNECCVVGRKRNGSDYYEAVAFVVKKAHNQDDKTIIAELKALCTENLPTYMIPAKIYFIRELPHTPIGKIDFRTLETMAKQAG